MKSFFVEGYGCSLNMGETEQIAGFLLKNNFAREPDLKKADFVIINTCSVKQATEQRMVSRMKFLLANKKPSAKLLVTGCLAASEHEIVAKISGEIIVLDTSLASLCSALGIVPQEFSPEIPAAKQREFISILPVSTGCLGACTYCSARLARKELHSYPVRSVVAGFERALASGSREIWLTSQDLGCYGFDIGTSLPKLVHELLKVGGDYRIRLGMMNPDHFTKIKKELLSLFSDERLYKFLHLPVQSGSDKVLKSMNRGYSVKDFAGCVAYARKKAPSITVSTDIIVGFPNETGKDFAATMRLMEKVKPDVVNISRFGKRKGTVAEKMAGQVNEMEKKRRSAIAAKKCDSISLKKNQELVKKTLCCLVSERATDGFNARTDAYRPVFVKSGFGHFAKVRIFEARAHFFKGKVLEELD